MKTRQRGFTLLETLVALAVIGIALAAAMRSTRFAIDTVNELKTRTAAGWVAQNLAGGLRAARAFPEMGAASGRAAQGRQEFLWRQEVGGTPNYSFRRVEIKVFLPERPEHAVARQVVYVARQQN
jgi:general secretion pathway protein I